MFKDDADEKEITMATKIKELTKSLGNGDALKDRNERDDDNRGAKLRQHAAKGNHLILNII